MRVLLARTAGSYESVAAELTGPMCLGGEGEEDDALGKSGTVGRVEASSSAINVDDDTVAAMEKTEKAETREKEGERESDDREVRWFQRGGDGCLQVVGRQGGAWLLSSSRSSSVLAAKLHPSTQSNKSHPHTMSSATSLEDEVAPLIAGLEMDPQS